MKTDVFLLVFSISFLFLFLKPSYATSIVGEFQPLNEIKIESQDYIDKYFSFSFKEIDDKTWYVNFTINQNIWKDLDACRKTSISEKASCISLNCTAYFLTKDFNCDNTNKAKLITDLTSLASNNYPLKNLTENIDFSNSKFIFDIDNGNGSFYIKFPNGFKINEKASFGFGSTNISSTVNTGCLNSMRCICRDGQNNIHVVYRYNTTHIWYANSSTEGSTWTLNNSFLNGTTSNTRYEPTISCNGNNISVAYEDYTADSLMVALSIDNGATWTWYNVTKLVDTYIGIERRGANIYVAYRNSSSTQGINFINSTNEGVEWGPSIPIPGLVGANSMYFVNLVVNGTGTTADKIYVLSQYYSSGGGSRDGYFVNSTNSGVTWSSVVTALNTGWEMGGGLKPTMTYSHINPNNISAVGFDRVGGTSGPYTVIYGKSTNGGATWSETSTVLDSTTSSIDSSSITVGPNGNFWVFWTQPDPYTGNDLVFRGNGTSWENEKFITYDNESDVNINTKWDFSGNKIEFVWKRGAYSTNTMYYSYIGYTGEPNIVGLPSIIPWPYNKSQIINCTVLYNGANNGRIDFIWYLKNSTGEYFMGNYNGSSSDNADTNLTRVYTNVSLPITAFVKGDNVTCSARAYNGSTYSSWINSSTITVSNSPPTIVNQQSYVNGTNQFTITATATDPDGLTDISSCLSFYKLDEPKQVDDFTTFHNPTNKTGTYTSGDGNCSTTITTSDSGQLRYGKDISTATQAQIHNLITDSNYIYVGESSGTFYTYKLDKANLTVYNSTTHGYAEKKWSVCQNTDWIFVGQTGELLKINKTGFSATALTDLNTNFHCQADDNFVFSGDNANNLSKWQLSDNTLNLSVDFGTGVINALFFNSTSDFIYSGDDLGVVKKINASNFTDVKWSLDKGTMYFYSVYESATSERDWIWAGAGNNILYILNENDGATNRSYDYGTGTINDIVADSDFVYFISTDDILRKLNKTQARVNNNFTPEWSINFGEDLVGLDIQGNYLYVLTTNMGVWKVDINSGTTIAVNDEVVTKIRFTDSSGATAETTGNSNIMPSVADTTSPTYSLNSTDSTVAGTPISHNLKWTDNVGLSGYIFSFDNCTGTLVNNSWVSMTGTGNWSNVTKTINSTVGCTIRWCVYANDTANNWNETSCVTPFSYVTTEFTGEISECSVLDQAGETYLLTADIIDSDANICMDIQANNITLDCQGHLIDSDRLSFNYGIIIAELNIFNTTIKNCVVSDWGLGIDFYGADIFGVTIINNTFNNSQSANIEMDGVVNATLINNTIINSDDIGICFGFYDEKQSENWTVTNNFIANNVNGLSLYGIGHTIYNNFFNNTVNIYYEELILSNCHFNITQQEGTRIYSDGTQIGGNYWTNSTGNGYSDTCIDANTDGFCDSPYNVTTNSFCTIGVDCGDNVDYFPYSDEYTAAQEYNQSITEFLTLLSVQSKPLEFFIRKIGSSIFSSIFSRLTSFLKSVADYPRFSSVISRLVGMVKLFSDSISFNGLMGRLISMTRPSANIVYLSSTFSQIPTRIMDFSNVFILSGVPSRLTLLSRTFIGIVDLSSLYSEFAVRTKLFSSDVIISSVYSRLGYFQRLSADIFTFSSNILNLLTQVTAPSPGGGGIEEEIPLNITLKKTDQSCETDEDCIGLDSASAVCIDGFCHIEVPEEKPKPLDLIPVTLIFSVFLIVIVITERREQIKETMIKAGIIEDKRKRYYRTRVGGRMYELKRDERPASGKENKTLKKIKESLKDAKERLFG